MKKTQQILLAASVLAACATVGLGMGSTNGSRTRGLPDNDRSTAPLRSTPTNRLNMATGGVWRSSAQPDERVLRLAQTAGGSDWSPGVSSRPMGLGGVTGAVGGAAIPIPNASWQSGDVLTGPGSMSATGMMGGATGMGMTNSGFGTQPGSMLEPNAGSSGSGSGSLAPQPRTGTGTGGGVGAGGAGSGM